VYQRLTVTVATIALVVPNYATLAAAAVPKAAAKKIVTVKKTFTGGLGQADQWGNVQITMVVTKKTTTTGSRKTVKRHIDSIKVPVFPDHTGRSQFISSIALPILVKEALKAQSTHIYIVSGATFTSDAFAGSLQGAIAKARAW
jgi:uncharacterized protein with FMN-binding domain